MITLKQTHFQGNLISAIEDNGEIFFRIESPDPWGNLHHWKDSDDVYEDAEQAIEAAKVFVGNYEPADRDPLDFDYAEAAREVMGAMQKLK